jgi:predicted YcjX-like family ATPase
MSGNQPLVEACVPPIAQLARSDSQTRAGCSVMTCRSTVSSVSSANDRLEAILRHLTKRAISRVESVGAEVDVIALSAVRATREGMVGAPDEPTLKAVIGTPLEGERIGDEIFDGQHEAAICPGELPADPKAVFSDSTDYRIVRFRPPVPVRATDGTILPPPHIRLDRALEFLLGDQLATPLG